MGRHCGKSKGWMLGVLLVVLSPLQWGQSRPAEDDDPEEGPADCPHQNVTVALGAAALLHMPPGDLATELAKIKPAEPPKFRAGTYKLPVLLHQELWLTQEEYRQAQTQPAGEQAAEKIKDADEQHKRRLAYVEPYVEELKKALDGSAVPAEQRQRIITQYSLCLLSLAVYKQRTELWHSTHGGEGQAQVTRPAGLTVPEGLPTDLGQYLHGAIAWYGGRREEAVAAWQKAVESGGKYRSVWAAFMLGRAHLGKDAGAAIQWFRRTRELAAAGMDDSRFLAAESLGLEARAELDRKNYVQAVRLYLAQQAAGDETAAMSLRDVVVRALAGGLKAAQADGAAALAAMEAFAADPLARQAVTAWLVCDGGPLMGRPLLPTAAQAKHWLRCVAAAANLDTSEPAQLAWLALRSGDAAAARTWSDRAVRPSLTADWVRAKLLLADGRLEEGQGALEPLLNAAEAQEVWPTVFVDTESSEAESFCPRRRIAAELAIVQVQRGLYAEALAGLMERGYWVDAAYVAERLMKTEELKTFVDARCPEAGAIYHPDELTGPQTRPAEGERNEGAALRAQLARRLDRAAKTKPADRPGLLAARLRYLLGRRLVRQGQAQEALAYLPPRWRKLLERYIALVAAGRKDQPTPADAGKTLWSAAMIAKSDGMELMGTELGPDWTLCHGWAPYDDPAAVRAAQAGKGPLAPTAEELARLKASAPNPNRRFHYRFVAAELAWEAAALMPDEKPETATVLYTAGRWMRSKDSQMAGRFYKALVRRCGTTDIGKRAKEAKWLP